MTRLTRFLTSEWTKRTVVLVMTVFVAIAIRDYFVLHKGWSKWAVTPIAATMYYLAFALYDWGVKPWSWKTRFKELRRTHAQQIAAQHDEWAKAATGAIKAALADREAQAQPTQETPHGRKPAAPHR